MRAEEKRSKHSPVLVSRANWTALQRRMQFILGGHGLTLIVFTNPNGKFTRVDSRHGVVLDCATDGELLSFCEGIRFANRPVPAAVHLRTASG